ncbi:MAG: M48 family metalloprotease [Solirubrobacterales bacterium]
MLAGLVADLVLWPREQLPPAIDANAHYFFSEAFIVRATNFRGLQSWLSLIAGFVTVAIPVVVACCWPRGVREGSMLARWSDRRSGAVLGRGGAVADAAVACAIGSIALVAALPLQCAMYARAHRAGLVLQNFDGWLSNWLLGALLTLLALALLAMLAGWLIRTIGRMWWTAFGVILIAIAIVFQMFSPILVEPLFANFTKLPAGPVRSDVEQIARRSGVHAGEIYTVDAASRTTGANAYVTGLGSTKRVVIYDTLLKDFTPAERRAVLAHEFGHAKHRDVVAGLVWFGFVALVSLFAIDLLARALARSRGVDFASPAGIAMLLAAALIAIAVSQPAANAWSRKIEARADAFALAVTQKPDAAIALEQRLTTRNLSRPEPPSALQFFFGTHPTPMQRIGMAVTVRRELARGKVEPLP